MAKINDKPAETYAKPHKMTGAALKQSDVLGSGYPDNTVKTSGIEVRGRSKQTKGKLARGPMA